MMLVSINQHAGESRDTRYTGIRIVSTNAD